MKRARAQKQQQPEAIEEKAGGISSHEVIRLTLPPSGHLEVREKQNGTWAVSYPDPAWIPCAPNCHLGLHGVMRGHKHDFGPPSQIETHYQPTSFEDAMQWAEYLSEGREIKVLDYVPLHERRKRKPELTDGE